MDFLTWARRPWGEDILTHISWDLLWASVRPEKWWITRSMLLGWITRRQYLEHHDPDRWTVRGREII